MGKKCDYKYKVLDKEEFSGSGYVIVGINSNPQLLRVENFSIDSSYELDYDTINGLIRQARNVADMPKGSKIYVDTYAICNLNYIALEEKLFEPEDFSPFDYDNNNELEDFFEYFMNH